MILRCTGKLLAVLRTELPAHSELRPDAEDWYGNLLWFDRRKCLLLTHSGTLFSVFEADVHVSELRDIRRVVARLIGRELAREDLPACTFGPSATESLTLARTADRSVLGCMNDMRSCAGM